MIVLDTHIWIWWVNNSPPLTEQHRRVISIRESDGLGVSIFSCWEVAKLVEKNRIQLSLPVDQWLDQALAYPGVQLLNLTVPILVKSTQLPGFHNDPADQIIVATAQAYNCPLLTADFTALCAAMRDSIESLKPYTTTLFPIPYSLAQSAIRLSTILMSKLLTQFLLSHD